MLNLITNYEKAKAACDAADAAYTNDFENVDLENAFMTAYKAEFDAGEKLIDAITTVAPITRSIARKMITTQLEALKSLVERFC